MCRSKFRFREFIREYGELARTLERKQAEGISSWVRFRWVFFSAAIAIGLFLFLTERELFNAGVAMLGALAVAVPTLMRFLGGMQRVAAPRE